MKKMIATLLAGCLVFGTSACGDTTSTPTNEDKTIEQKATQENTDTKELQDNNTDETEELAEFDRSGDEFIDIMNNSLKATYPDLVLTDLKTEEREEEGIKRIVYYTMKDNVFVSYTVNEETNNVCLFTTIIENDNLNENTHFNASIYFTIASSALRLQTEIDDLIENLNMTDYMSKNGAIYNTDEAKYAKVFTDKSFAFLIEVPNNNN